MSRPGTVDEAVREYITWPRSWTEALNDPDHTPPTRREHPDPDNRRTRPLDRSPPPF